MILNFAAMGFLGGLAYVLLWATEWKDLKTLESFRHIVIGAIVGYVYTHLHSDWGYPNAVMCFVAGYFGVDFIQGLVEKVRKKQGNNER